VTLKFEKPPKGSGVILTRNNYTGQMTFRITDGAIPDFIYDATDNSNLMYNGSLSDLLPHAGSFKEKLEAKPKDEQTPVLKKFVEYIDGLYQNHRKTYEKRLSEGKVMFDDLPILFAKGTEVVMPNPAGQVGGTVEKVELFQTFFGKIARIHVKTVSHSTGKIQFGKQVGKMYDFGISKLGEMPIRLATPADKATLSTRGETFRKFASGAGYVRYNGSVMRKGWFGEISEFKADGRAVIDSAMAHKMDPNYFKTYNNSNDDGESGAVVDDGEFKIPDENLWMCEPVVMGFSFPAKMWGELRVSDVQPIQFRTDAFQRLVMDEVKKKTILALVKRNGSAFSDLIESKGGGCIFLLHGPPGTGKTLTAEAVAEELQRPLYSVSVGELGTDPAALETRLRQILEMATTWNAVVLLDEADIFLEARDEQNILRNAMVGVFLRLLEYHNGVLFLTTNRVKQFDRAFHSRISVALEYPEMDSDTRNKIWTTLLDAAKIPNVKTETLSLLPINGRQIKNAIRLAQTLAGEAGRGVVENDLHDMVKLASEFEQKVKPISKPF
jgi:hypothetical protein